MSEPHDFMEPAAVSGKAYPYGPGVKVRLKQDWFKFKAGEVAEVTEHHAKELITFGWAEAAD